MYPNSTGRRSNPVRISMFDREDKNLSRSEHRRTQMSKPKGISIGETSHIPRPRFRSSSNDRASGRISYLKPGKPSLCQPTTPNTPAISNKTNITGSGRHRQTTVSMCRSPSVERPSSVGAKGPRKDTRPLTDKTYQTMLLNKIDNFFRVNQRSMMLNNTGSLKPITLKMFTEVSNFLLKLLKVLDIKQELTNTNYVEELPQCAKKLHYPGLINKSWLKTANAMHSWPCVLGWIGWLVEACQVQELAFDRYQLETLPFVGTEQQAQRFKTEFLALLESYKAWNDEKLDEEAELLDKYLQDIEIQQGINEEDIAQIHKYIEEDTLKLQMIEEEIEKVDQEVECAKATLLSLHTKESKQLNNFKATEKYINEISANSTQLDAECNVLNEQIQMGNVQREKLISVVRDQPISKTQREEIKKMCTEIQNYIHEFDEHLKDYQKESYTLDIKLASINNNLSKAVLAYNKEFFMYIDNDTGFSFDELKLPEQGLFNPKMMEIFKEKAALMKTFKESLAKQCNDAESLIRSDTIKLENMQEKIKSSLDDKKLKEQESHVNKAKIDAKKEKFQLVEQVETLENEIKEIQNMMPDIQTVKLEIEEAEDKVNAVTRRKIFLEQSAKSFFGELYKIIGAHRNELHDILTKTD